MRNAKKLLVLAVIFTMLVVSFAMASGEKQSAKASKVLRMLTWEGYAPASLVEKFKSETGLDVQIAYIGDNNELIAKLAATKGQGYDLIQPTYNWVTIAQNQYGVYAPLEMDKIKTDQIDPQLFKTVTEGTKINGKSYAIPFCWGTTAMIVNTKYAPEAGKTYKDFCNPKYAGRITYRAKYDSFYMFAYALGLDPAKAVSDEKAYRDVMEKTLKKMIECKKYVKTYWGSRQELEDLLLREEVWVASCWDAIAFSLTPKHPELQYRIPKEGAVGWIDTLAVSAGAENVEGAYKWINFIMKPENAAVIANKTGYSMASNGYLKYVTPERAKMVKEIFTPEVVKNIKWYFPLPSYAVDIEADVQERLKAAPSE